MIYKMRVSSSHLPTYHCHRREGPIRINGRLTETAWKRAVPVYLRLTDSGRAPQQDTCVRLLWDDRFLYLGFECRDQYIRGTYRHHDDPIFNEEVVEVFLCPASPSRKEGIWVYFELELSPRNVLFDTIVVHPRKGQPKGRSPHIKCFKQWHCKGANTAVQIDGKLNVHKPISTCWTVEMAIPFKEMFTAPRIPPVYDDAWRMNLYRIDRAPRHSEFSAWAPTGLRDFHIPEKFGRIIFAS